MIGLTRSLARCYRTVLRRSLLEQEPRRSWSLLACKAGDDGLTLQCTQAELALRYHHPHPRPADWIIFRTDLLAQFEGRMEAPVVLEQIAPDKGRARWDDAGVPCSLEFDSAATDRALDFPEMPDKFTPMPPSLLTALDEASRTASREQTGRFALTRIQLRVKRGDVVATDGRQLLVQAGFPFPWHDDVLIPRSSVFGCREFACHEEVLLGRTKTHVAVRCGPWTLLLLIDGSSRYPDTQAIIPRTVSISARLVFDKEDAALLTSILPKLPGVRDDNAPVTLDLSKPPVVRAC